WRTTARRCWRDSATACAFLKKSVRSPEIRPWRFAIWWPCIRGTMALRSVLIVSPNFPPINAPDHQRVRMALPYFTECGWEPVVLSVAAEYSESSRDETLTATLPEDVEIHRVSALQATMTRTVGLGRLVLRSIP